MAPCLLQPQNASALWRMESKMLTVHVWILLALLVTTAACGPVTTNDERMPALRTTGVTRMQQKADEAFGATRDAEPIFRARVATCVQQLAGGGVRGVDYNC